MRPQALRVSTVVALGVSLVAASGCGKRADPLAPYVKTPQPPTGLEVAQVGNELELRVIAPRTTTENRPLPVIQIVILQAPPTGDFGKGAKTIFREDVAPGEVRTRRFSRPAAAARFSARAESGKTRSTSPTPVLFKPAPVPLSPTDLKLENLATGVELRWTNPPGAEPWPTPAASPSPSSSAAAKPASGATPLTAGAQATPGETRLAVPPAPTPEPSPALPAAPNPSPAPQAGTSPQAVGASPATGAPGPSPPGAPAASPKPSPTPALVLPTAIRIFRTDGTARLAREPLQASSWTDPTPRPGDKPCYALRYASSLKPLVESESTPPVCIEVKDIVAPESPPRLVADLGPDFVELSWTASPSADVAFYRIYRTLGAGARTMFLETEGLVLRVQDKDLTSGPRVYEVVAVDKGGNESPASPGAKIAIP